MRIAVITPAHNAAATLGDTLRSVLAQTHAAWRMVVVDDGSSDGTADVAASFQDARIRVIGQAHAGVSAARNRGLGNVDGDAFLFLDADDCLARHALAAMARALAADPMAIAATGGARFFGAGGKRGRRRNLPAPHGELLPGLLVRNRLANCGQMLAHRYAVRTVGGFRSELRFGEDWEFAIRLATQGRFVAADAAPVLFVRERMDGAYWQRAADPAALQPCLKLIFANPLLLGRFSAERLRALRQTAEAEHAWVVGRALLRRGETSAGRRWLGRSVAAAPSAKRIAALIALCGHSLLATASGAPDACSSAQR